MHCVAHSWGAQLVAGLNVAGPVIRKGTGGEDGYSGFAVRDADSGAVRATELAQLLRQRGINRVVILGLATDYCVKETALDAVSRGLSTTVLRNAIAAVDLEEGDGDRALAEVAAAGATISES